MMKKNLSADGITKPNDLNRSVRNNHQFVRWEIGSSKEKEKKEKRKAASSLILQLPIMTQNPSLTRGRICSRCVRAVHYSQNECPYFGHYLHEKVQKVSDSGGKQTRYKRCLRKKNAVTVMASTKKYISLHNYQLSTEFWQLSKQKKKKLKKKKCYKRERKKKLDFNWCFIL